MTVLEEEVLVSAPPGRVWEVVSDPRNLPQWDRRIAGVTGVPDGGLTNGSTYTTEMFRGGPLGDLAARAVRMFGARSLLRRGEQAQKRQAESSG